MTEQTQPTDITTPADAQTPARNKLLELLKSRKFWAALIGLILIIIKSYDPNFPIQEDALTNVIYLLVAYILGTGLESALWLQNQSK